MKRWLALCLLLLILTPSAAAAEADLPFAPSDWAREEVESAVEQGLLYEEALPSEAGAPISRGDFACQAAATAAAVFGSDLESYLLIMSYRGQAEREDYFHLYPLDVARSLGILLGRGDGEEDPASPITRQEAAVMLARTYRACQESALEREEVEPSFSDRGDIAEWALDDVGLMEELGVMTGVGEGRFDPLGSYTVEQCVVSLARFYEALPRGGARAENPFAIPRLEGGFFRTWEEPYDIAFALETEAYYLCAWDRSTMGIGLGGADYEVAVIDRNLSLRVCQVPILTSSSIYRGAVCARPEQPVLSEDGTELSYTVVLEEDAYHIFGLTEADRTLLFPKGVYTVILDLDTGAQNWSRAELE